jgi:pyruvate/2-oxoglutarate dehydrogenase complex dihydrolipoamide acyltransferase (E2) component
VIPGSADGLYEFGSFMSATLSCDHRVIDGKLLVFVRCLHGLWTGN